ncbi:hypothetical protein D9N32_01210 (plasmid) [Escherichia coli]|nr:hypothetical protein [Escherichia coli]AQV87246.1 hypothetical protein BE948_00605 [Escherichia coli]ASB81644.1 hypothetical protein AM384_25130 [Escherichia coli]AYL08279.1 hypothetical protein D9N32_01210 [Escherichia coli]RSC79435.1 hypothetical protein EGS82_00640 [Escherichia coli]
MGSCAAPSAKGDDKFITTDYLQQCPEKQLCRHLCSGKQAGQNSLGPNGTTANLCSITAEIHRFKELLIWFCEY